MTDFEELIQDIEDTREAYYLIGMYCHPEEREDDQEWYEDYYQAA